MSIFEKFEVFNTLPQTTQEKIYASGTHIEFSDGEPIFWEDDNTQDVYFILDGSAKSYTESASGNRVYFKTRKAGEIFGYYAAFTGLPRSATMIAKGKTKLLKIPQSDFLTIASHNPAIAQYCLELLGNLLRSETIRLTNIITNPVYERVIITLLSSSNEETFSYPIDSREDMAVHINTTRESLSRVLNQLQTKKLIKIHKKFIEILSRHTLKKEIVPHTD